MSSSSSSAPPRPMPMAIMRNAHEVIRGAMADIQGLINDGELTKAGRLWRDLHRFNDLHMAMEEGVEGGDAPGLFQMMDDHADNAATKAGLRDQHVELEKLEHEVEECLVTTPNLQKAKEAFPKLMEFNEQHLVQEEAMLMPNVQKLVKTGHPVKKYIATYLMPTFQNDDDLKFFIRFANQILERHENGMPRVRVFDQALWAIAQKPDQWKQWKQWIQESLTPAKFDNVMGQIQAFVEQQKAANNNQQPGVPRVKQPRWMRVMKNPVEC